MAHISLDELLALGAGGSAGMVSLNGRFLGVLGTHNVVELDDEALAYVEAVRGAPVANAPAPRPPRARPAKAKPPADPAPEAPTEE